ncbi:MAG: hypothetical protein AAGB32_05750 [Pseudomonadota bacterium]
MEVSSQIAASLAQTRADASISFIRDNAEQDQQIADLLQSAASSVPGSPIRGTNVNISV